LLADTPDAARSRLYLLPAARYREPLFSWKYAIAPTDIEFLDGSGLGAEHDNEMLVGTVLTGMLLRLPLNADHSDFDLPGSLVDRVDDNTASGIIREVGDAAIFGRGFGVVTDIAPAPCGSIWVASILANALYQIARR
jgi:glucose/arabinose dehydrogenase